MHRAGALLILWVITLPLLLQTVVIANYAIRKDYYAKVLCENQDKPEMSCEGKCSLYKELKAASNQENPLVPVKPVKMEPYTFLIPISLEANQSLDSREFAFGNLYFLYQNPFRAEILFPPEGLVRVS